MECYGYGINDAWIDACLKFLDFSHSITWCGRRYFIMDDLLMHIKVPNVNKEVSELCPWDRTLCSDYISAALSEKKGYEIRRIYNYGEDRIDQYKMVVSMMKENANFCYTISCVDPKEDLVLKNTLPCLSTVVITSIERRICTKAVYSMMDLFTYGLLDMYQMANLQKHLCEDTGFDLGELSLFISQATMSFENRMVLEKYLAAR